MLARIAGGSPNISLKTRVYVTMLPEVLQELKAYVEHYGTEVSGCGLVEKYELKEKDQSYTEFRVTEVFLPSEQDNSAGSTDIDPEVIHEIMNDLLQQNKDTSKIKFHWHSHAAMDVFHSSTDEENYDELNNKDFLVSMVLNKAGDIYTSIHLYSGLGLDIKDVELYTFVPDATKATEEKIKNNIQKLDEHTKKENEKKIGCWGNGWGKKKSGKTTIYGSDKTDLFDGILSDEEIEAGEMCGMTPSEVRKAVECRTTECVSCELENKCYQFNGVLASQATSYSQRMCAACGEYTYSEKTEKCWRCGGELVDSYCD